MDVIGDLTEEIGKTLNRLPIIPYVYKKSNQAEVGHRFGLLYLGSNG